MTARAAGTRDDEGWDGRCLSCPKRRARDCDSPRDGRDTGAGRVTIPVSIAGGIWVTMAAHSVPAGIAEVVQDRDDDMLMQDLRARV